MTTKVNQYGFTAAQWEEVVTQGCVLHDDLMMAEGDWDQESHVIMQCLIKRKQEQLELRAEIENLLKSAMPNERDHPTMSPAWRRAEALLAR
jgi:hypothetical protein